MHRCIGRYVLIAFFLSTSLLANDVNTGGQKGVVRALSAYTFGKTGLHAGGSYRLASEMEYIKGSNGKGDVTDIQNRSVSRENPYLMTGDIFCAYGITSFLDIAADMPLYEDVTGWGKSEGGAGDLGLSVKLANPFQKENAFFNQSYYFKVIFPTGSSGSGYFPRHSYYLNDTIGTYPFSAKAFFFNPEMAWTFDFGKIAKAAPLQLHINFGGVIAEQKRNSALIAAVAVEYSPVPLITLFAEVAGESRVLYYSEVFDVKAMNNDPLWVSPGATLHFPHGFYATLAGDIGISDKNSKQFIRWNRKGYRYSTKATPTYGVQLSFGWSAILVKPDRDGDGILDEADSCPDQPEDVDGFQDKDGCPDPDNDHDGFIDSQDRCPDSAGPDGGCPVYDNDHDGILNNVDKCPDEAEDKDGFQDSDGCPDPDNDADGVVDTKDSCPNKAEDLDGFEDGDGCPDLDNDGDGVSDAEDKCPGVRGLPENNGCPKTKEISRSKLILNGVTFQAGKAILTSNSFTILDQVYESLSEWPEVKLEIQGHTDNMGDDMTNLRLSQLRADEVKKYLINKGINPGRLRSVGYGEEFPIADNHTADGREKNRRVELRRID